MSLATYGSKKKKKKKKKKKVGGLGWGNANYPGAVPAGEVSGFSGGAMGESLLRDLISSILHLKQ
jgi:hypothetical protein